MLEVHEVREGEIRRLLSVFVILHMFSAFLHFLNLRTVMCHSKITFRKTVQMYKDQDFFNFNSTKEKSLI